MPKKIFMHKYYEKSNIRQWLNSSEKYMEWQQAPPILDNLWIAGDGGEVWGDYNPYANEKGFLADGNFSEGERNLIMPHKHKVILDESYANDRDGGSEALIDVDGKQTIQEVMQNAQNAYFKMFEDQVFLPSLELLDELIIEQESIEDSFLYAKPTKQAFELSDYREDDFIKGDIWKYWTDTPGSFNYYYVPANENLRFDGLNVISDQGIDATFPYSGEIGVRPLLVLNNKAAMISKNGRGTVEQPYQVEHEPIKQ
jgi:hypothetical protein